MPLPEYSSVGPPHLKLCCLFPSRPVDRLTSNDVSSVQWIAPPLKDVSNQSNRINRINRSSSIGDLTHTRDVVCFGVYRLHVFGIGFFEGIGSSFIVDQRDCHIVGIGGPGIRVVGRKTGTGPLGPPFS